MMKRFMMFLAMGLLMTSSAAISADAVEKPLSCRHCGMDRAFFAHSRMLVTYADGAIVGLCSINCAVIEMKHSKGRQVKSLMVADYFTKELTDVNMATWVVGGKVNGVMTSVAKWAFAGREGAEKFVKENGGRITTFEEALELALKENE